MMFDIVGDMNEVQLKLSFKVTLTIREMSLPEAAGDSPVLF